MHYLDIIGVGLYFLMLVYVGYSSARKVKSSDDFAVAGNKIIWPILFATLAASFLGGGASIGRAGKSFTDGYAFMFAASAFPLATVLAGIYIAPRLKRYLGAHTVGDVMEHHYGSGARLFTGIFSLLFCTGILGAQALAIGTVFNAVLGMDVTTGIIVGMAVVLLYSTVGGMWAVIQTDVIQFVMLAIFMPLTMIIGLQQAGGSEAFLNALPDAHLTFTGNFSIAAFLSIFVAFLLGETLVPPYAQRALAAPDARNAKLGYSMAGLFGFMFYFVSATIGLLAFVMYPGINPDLALPTLIKTALPVGIVGLVLATLLAVVMSTADSYLNSAAVIFSKDIWQRFIEPDLAEQKKLWLERIVNLALGIAAIIFALYATSIVDALLLTYALWAPTVLIPFVAGVLFNLKCRHSAVAAMVSGALTTGIWKWGPVDLAAETGISALIAGVIINIIVFTLVYKISGKNRRLNNAI